MHMPFRMPCHEAHATTVAHSPPRPEKVAVQRLRRAEDDVRDQIAGTVSLAVMAAGWSREWVSSPGNVLPATRRRFVGSFAR
jgi:hypothetical protein